MHQEFIIPASFIACLILVLDRREFFHWNVDICEVFLLCLVSLIELYDDSQPFLAKDLKGIDGSVEGWYIVIPPLFWLKLLLETCKALLP